jgi:hypothetical protein
VRILAPKNSMVKIPSPLLYFSPLVHLLFSPSPSSSTLFCFPLFLSLFLSFYLLNENQICWYSKLIHCNAPGNGPHSKTSLLRIVACILNFLSRPFFLAFFRAIENLCDLCQPHRENWKKVFFTDSHINTPPPLFIFCT